MIEALVAIAFAALLFGAWGFVEADRWRREARAWRQTAFEGQDEIEKHQLQVRVLKARLASFDADGNGKPGGSKPRGKG